MHMPLIIANKAQSSTSSIHLSIFFKICYHLPFQIYIIFAVQVQPMPSCGVRPCVCLSVTFVDCVKTSNRIFKIFSPSGNQAILAFSIPNAMAIFRWERERRMQVG